MKVLFICSQNMLRSPTAEALYRSDARLEVRSAGIRSSAKRRISRADIEWANVIFVMDREQKQWIQEQFRDARLANIRILDIPDALVYMHPELQRLLREALDPEIAALLASDSPEP